MVDSRSAHADPCAFWAVSGLPEITPGADLAALIRSASNLKAGDILVISSKIVAKSLGLHRPGRTPAQRTELLREQSLRIVAGRRTARGITLIGQSAAGPVQANMGIDDSNCAPGSALPLPADCDAQARLLRAQLGSAPLGVIISDTSGRPWRCGQSDFAVGAAGVIALADLRGARDCHGQTLRVTETAIADELAAAADLVKGKLGHTPVAVLRGLEHLVTIADGPGAATLLRPAEQDWFRLGHVEAIWAALGVDLESWQDWPSAHPESPPGHPAKHPPAVLDLISINRALTVAQLGLPSEVRLRLEPDPANPPAAATTEIPQPWRICLDGEPFWRGVAAQRLQLALHAEGITAELAPEGLVLSAVTIPNPAQRGK